MFFVRRYGFTRLPDFWYSYSPQLSFDHSQPQIIFSEVLKSQCFPSLASLFKGRGHGVWFNRLLRGSLCNLSSQSHSTGRWRFFLKTMFEDHLRMRMIKEQQWREWQCDNVHKGWEHGSVSCTGNPSHIFRGGCSMRKVSSVLKRAVRMTKFFV